MDVLLPTVWNSFAITGHFCPYIFREETDRWRKEAGTRLRKGHFVTVEKLILY